MSNSTPPPPPSASSGSKPPLRRQNRQCIESYEEFNSSDLYSDTKNNVRFDNDIEVVNQVADRMPRHKRQTFLDGFRKSMSVDRKNNNHRERRNSPKRNASLHLKGGAVKVNAENLSNKRAKSVDIPRARLRSESREEYRKGVTDELQQPHEDSVSDNLEDDPFDDRRSSDTNLGSYASVDKLLNPSCKSLSNASEDNDNSKIFKLIYREIYCDVPTANSVNGKHPSI